jgi:hypothetical protein
VQDKRVAISVLINLCALLSAANNEFTWYVIRIIDRCCHYGLGW